MTATLRYGLRIPAVHPTNVPALRDFVVEAEKLGFDSIWVGDHVFYHVDVVQPLHLLTWVAAQTSRVRLGTGAMLSAYLNPVLLAKAAASIDYLSGGRLTLGMSIGGSEAEYRSIGVPMNQRVGRLLESVAIMRALWRGDDVSYAGKYYEVEQGNIKPKPAQAGGVPIYFGAFGEPMFRRIARVADGWVGGSGGIDRFLAGVESIRGFATEQGRDPDSLGFSKLQNVSLDADPARARQLAETHWQEYYGPSFNVEAATIFGTPEQCAEQLSAFEQASAPQVTVVMEPSSLDLRQLELLAGITVGKSSPR
jgi:probable F420-dependent oxidoreductase